MKYYSAKTVTQLLGVTAQTLRNWDKEVKLSLEVYLLFKLIKIINLIVFFLLICIII